MESTNQAVATTASQPSAMPTSAAPQSVAQSGMSPSVSYQASPTTAQMGQPAPAYQAAPAAPASAANPWQEGVSGPERKLEYKQPLPGPGTVLGLPNTDPSGQSNKPTGLQLSNQRKPSIRQPRLTVPQASTPGLLGNRGPAACCSKQAASLQSAAPASDTYLSKHL